MVYYIHKHRCFGSTLSVFSHHYCSASPLYHFNYQLEFCYSLFLRIFLIIWEDVLLNKLWNDFKNIYYFRNLIMIMLLCWFSVAQLCPTLCDLKSYSMPDSSVFHYWCLLRFLSIEPIEWCHPTISPSVTLFSFCLQSFPASWSFPVSQMFSSGGQSIGTSASAISPSMNVHGWFSLGLIGLISLQSKGLSIVFSSTTVQ